MAKCEHTQYTKPEDVPNEEKESQCQVPLFSDKFLRLF